MSSSPFDFGWMAIDCTGSGAWIGGTVKDGVIESPAKCHFDPSTLLCKGPDSDGCLTAPQIAALKKIYAGPKTSAAPGKVRLDEQQEACCACHLRTLPQSSMMTDDRVWTWRAQPKVS